KTLHKDQRSPVPPHHRKYKCQYSSWIPYIATGTDSRISRVWLNISAVPAAPCPGITTLAAGNLSITFFTVAAQSDIDASAVLPILSASILRIRQPPNSRLLSATHPTRLSWVWPLP